MQLKLSDKIKKYRKEMELTQEGLAEAIGVTVGAVSKWENGNTVPDIMTLMQLANFFNISMDELLGFDLTSKNVDDMCKSIENLCINHEFDQALVEANNAMLRYPHNFKVLHTAATVYYYKYLSLSVPSDAEKAIEYYRAAMDHISQNMNSEISEYSIKSRIAYLYRESDPEKAVELLKQINYDGNNFGAIGVILSEDLGKIDESMQYFTYSLIKAFSEQISTTFNIASVLATKGKIEDARKAVEMVKVEQELVKASAIQNTVSYAYKMRAVLLISEACLHSRLEELDEMERCVEESFALARAFDSSSDNRDLKSSMRFLFNPKDVVTHDTAGVGAVESVDNVLMVKIKSESGKQHKNVKRVLDHWNKIKEEKSGEE